MLSLKLTSGNKDKILLKTNVLPTPKASSAEHADKGGDVLTAYCDCTAGLSHCCYHVTAVLHKIEYSKTPQTRTYFYEKTDLVGSYKLCRFLVGGTYNILKVWFF